MKFRKFAKTIIAAVLCLSMVFGSVSVCFAAGKPFSYVSIGDSQSIAFGHRDYLAQSPSRHESSLGYMMHVKTAYSSILYENYLTPMYGKENVTWTQLGIAGTRPEEYLYFLGDSQEEYLDSGVKTFMKMFGGSAYNYSREEKSEDTKYIASVLSSEIKKGIEGADLLSIELGSNNVGAYLMYTLLGRCDGTADLQKLLNEMGSKLDINKLRSSVLDLLEKAGVDTSTITASTELLDALIYGTVGYCWHFDKLLEKIYELNPDVQIAVLGVINPMEDITVNYSGMELPLGDLVEPVYQVINLYTQLLSRYADRYYYVDLDANSDEIPMYYFVVKNIDSSSYSDEIKGVICQVVNDIGIETSDLSESELNTLCSQVHKAVASSSVVNFSIQSEVGGGFFEQALHADALAYINTYLKDGSLDSETEAKAEAVINAYMYMMGAFTIGVHATESGHAKKAELLQEAITNKRIARDYAIANAAGVLDIRDEMYAAVQKMSVASEAIQDYKDGKITIYEATDKFDEGLDDVITAVRKVSPLLAESIQAMKVNKNALMLMMAYMYENAGYSLYTAQDGSSYTAIVGSSISNPSEYTSAADEKIYYNLEGKTQLMIVDGSKTAAELGFNAAKTGSDLYTIDIKQGDVKAGLISSSTLTALQGTFGSYMEGFAELLSDLGIKIYKDALNDVRSMYNGLDKYCDVALQEISIGTTIHAKDSDALICYMGLRGASDETTKALYDITNMTLFLSAMFSDNTIYVDCTEESTSHAASQLVKHVTSTPEKRLYYNYYADILQSVSLAAKASPVATVVAMKDLVAGAWYEKAVNFCIDMGIMQGKAQSLFDPSGIATRSEVISMLYRLAGSPDVSELSSFKDVKTSSWYAKAAAWAKGTGLSLGDAYGNFNPQSTITRQDLITLLDRYDEITKSKSEETASNIDDLVSSFKDGASVLSYAKEAMNWAISEGIIKGVDMGSGNISLNPSGNVTRSQLAQFFYNYIN